MSNSKAFNGYHRSLMLLKTGVKGMAITLTLDNLALATVPFVEPIVFGRTIDRSPRIETRDGPLRVRQPGIFRCMASSCRRERPHSSP